MVLLSELLKRLQADGSTGADLSPGNDTSLAAYNIFLDFIELKDAVVGLMSVLEGTSAPVSREYNHRLVKLNHLLEKLK